MDGYGLVSFHQNRKKGNPPRPSNDVVKRNGRSTISYGYSDCAYQNLKIKGGVASRPLVVGEGLLRVFRTGSLACIARTPSDLDEEESALARDPLIKHISLASCFGQADSEANPKE
jgi:hypothetical protein